VDLPFDQIVTMKLNAAQAARCLDVSTDTVERWVLQGKIPSRVRGARSVFVESELRQWAQANGLPFHSPSDRPGVAEEPEGMSVADALSRGGFFELSGATTVREVLDALAQHAPVADSRREELRRRLEEREALSSTGIGGGIAVPHPREPLDGLVSEPVITTCFLSPPVEFRAIDGKNVSVAHLLLSPDTKTHLRLLSRLAFCLRNAGVTSLLAEGYASAQKLIDEVAKAESHVGA
jgi:PTS system nitrogen regulatory IIA component